MISSDTCFSQSNVNSISQIAPMYHNVPAQTSQINFLQQQQQQQQQQSNSQQQPMQCQPYYCYPANQQGGFPQNQYVQSYQQDPYGVNQQQQQPIQRAGLANLGQPLVQTSYNHPSIMQPQAIGYGSLPPQILDQIRSYIGTPPPIFILPSNCPNPPIQQPQIPSNQTITQGCPGIGINCPSPFLHGCQGGPCHHNTIGTPMYNQRSNSPQNYARDNKNCGCCQRKYSPEDTTRGGQLISPIYRYANDFEEHRCAGATDGTICTQKNCPSAINLQALASQLLAIPGVISCAATRLILRKIPGSSVTTTMEETMERAKRSLSSLNKEQLLGETRGAQQVNALINLHMTANPPTNVVPVLTTLQLKINLLKSQVDSALNRRLSENQGYGVAEGARNLDSVMLATKSDQELRDLLGTLRQKECDERVNLNFAPYQSQRVIAESRLTSVQNKIAQIEEEMDRRRAAALPRSSIEHRVSQHTSDPGCVAWYGYTGDVNNANWTTSTSSQNYESPDPFRAIQVKNPKRLNLKPHVGSPETTYVKSLKKSTKSSRTKKESDEDDYEDDEKRDARTTRHERPCCNCEKSSDDDSADEDKKKLGLKIREAGEIVSEKNDENSLRKNSVSVVKLSPNITIVIDNSGNVGEEKNHRCDRHWNRTNGDRSGNEVEKYRSVGEVKNSMANEKKNDKKPEETRKIKWKKNKAKDRIAMENPTKNHDSKVEDDKAEINDKIQNDVRMEDTKYKSAATTKNMEKSQIRLNRENSGSLREETVRMITDIQCEPTVFRGLRDDDKSEKEKIIEERYKGRIFTEDSSSNSPSDESTIGGNFTNESVSMRVENHNDAFRDSVEVEDEKKNPRVTVEKEVETKIVKNTNISSSNSDNDTKRNDETTKSEESRETSNGAGENESGNDMISGALSTIGNHVASFGSLIGKIATLKLHRTEEESIKEEFIEENSINYQRKNDDNVAAGSGVISKKINDTNKEIGRWRYIRFADVEDSERTSIEDVNASAKSSTTCTLPKIRHSVIEDKKNGEKYVVMEVASEKRNNLGEPYKTGRSLVIRSRPKSQQTNVESVPFSVIRGPRKRDKNCIALSLADVKLLRKNRTRNNNELKTSEKFWLKPETREMIEDEAKSRGISKITMRDEQRGNLSAMIDPRCSSDDNSNVVSNGADESVVEIHDYSKISKNPRIRFDVTS